MPKYTICDSSPAGLRAMPRCEYPLPCCPTLRSCNIRMSFLFPIFYPSSSHAASSKPMIRPCLISVSWLHAQIRASRGYRSRELGLSRGIRSRSCCAIGAQLKRTLNIADDGASGVVHELDANLSNTTARAGTAEDACQIMLAILTVPSICAGATARRGHTGDLDELDWLLSGIHGCE